MRQLENAIERAVVLSSDPILTKAHFPTLRRSPEGTTAASDDGTQRPGVAIPGSTLADIEREAILRTLEAVGGSTSRAAALLQISARKIQYKLKEYRQQGGVVPRRP